MAAGLASEAASELRRLVHPARLRASLALPLPGLLLRILMEITITAIWFLDYGDLVELP